MPVAEPLGDREPAALRAGRDHERGRIPGEERVGAPGDGGLAQHDTGAVATNRGNQYRGGAATLQLQASGGSGPPRNFCSLRIERPWANPRSMANQQTLDISGAHSGLPGISCASDIGHDTDADVGAGGPHTVFRVAVDVPGECLDHLCADVDCADVPVPDVQFEGVGEFLGLPHRR